MADPPGPDGKLTVNAVWLDSVNILRQMPDEGQDYVFSFRRSREFVFSEFREFVAEEMIIPKRLLVAETQFPYTAGTKLVLPTNCFIGRTDQHMGTSTSQCPEMPRFSSKPPLLSNIERPSRVQDRGQSSRKPPRGA